MLRPFLVGHLRTLSSLLGTRGGCWLLSLRPCPRRKASWSSSEQRDNIVMLRRRVYCVHSRALMDSCMPSRAPRPSRSCHQPPKFDGRGPIGLSQQRGSAGPEDGKNFAVPAYEKRRCGRPSSSSGPPAFRIRTVISWQGEGELRSDPQDSGLRLTGTDQVRGVSRWGASSVSVTRTNFDAP